MAEREIFIEPVTRIEGHVGVSAKADLDKKVYTNAYTVGTMFRGFEIIFRGREPADAVWLSQRVCGVCPSPHALAAVQAVDMAYNAPPPPMGIAIRNLTECAEELYDSPLGCIILEGADYSQAMVEKMNSDWWAAAKTKKAEYSSLHGFSTVADIMTALNPIAGQLWLRAVIMGKIGRKMAALFGAKHPHINTFVPGGVAYTFNPTDVEAYAAMLAQHVAFSKEFVPAMDDLINFLIEMGYDKAGARPTNLISYGYFDDPTAYDANYKNMPVWGAKRKVSPGLVVDGKLLTTDLQEIHLGVREFVTHSYYDEWGQEITSDTLGNPVAKEHPWNKDTVPAPGPEKKWDGKYSWCTAPRWHDWKRRLDGGIHVVEAGPLSRMWTTAKAKLVPESTGNSLRFTLPKATVVGYPVADEHTFEWKIPAKVNAIERIRARAYYHAYSAYMAYGHVLAGLDLLKKGVTQVWKRYEKPANGMGVGGVEAMRGGVMHWVVMKDGRIHRYQIMAPTNWNIGPRDKFGKPGPCEEAIIGTPVSEPTPEIKGLDPTRVLRSFDLCLGCTVNVYVGDRLVATRNLDRQY